MNDFSDEHASILSRRMERETISLSKSEFKKKANELSESAKKILRLRAGKLYSDELTKAGFQEVEVLTLLLEREDKRLSEWRQSIENIRSGVAKHQNDLNCDVNKIGNLNLK